MAITRILQICFIILAATPISSWALFTLNGQGTVKESSAVGVPGETIEYSFSYRLSDFPGDTSLAPSHVHRYPAFNPIPLKVTGSITGEFMGVSPITSVRLRGSGRFGTWIFLQSNTFFTDSRNEDTSDALIPVTSSSALESHSSSIQTSAFEPSVPNFFADAHAIFFPHHDDSSIWRESSGGKLLIHRGEGFLSNLKLRDIQWKITETEDDNSLFTVANTNDEGVGSLRQAISNANNTLGVNTIEFDPQLNGQTIVLSSGEILITEDIIISGLGADNLTISGNNNSDIFHFTGSKAIIDGLTITQAGGDAITIETTDIAVTNSNISSNAGSGILNLGGNLTVLNSTLSSNQIGIEQAFSDDLDSRLKLIISNSIISDNTLSGLRIDGRVRRSESNSFSYLVRASLTDSTISNNGGNGIAAITSVLSVVNSTISGNNAKGISVISGHTTISNSVVSNNAGGIFGDVIDENNADRDIPQIPRISIRNTTISGNSRNRGGGIFVNQGSRSASAGLLEIFNSTITGNSATEVGGGVLISSDSDTFIAVNVENTIIAGNRGPKPDVVGKFISNGLNLIGDLEGSTGFEADLTEADILKILDPVLQDNGGTTQTHKLVAGSPAIDAGGAVRAFNCAETDQIGQQRKGLACDIGAFEFQQQGSNVFTVTNTNDSGIGSLRQAVIDANLSPVDDTIEFDPSLTGQVINLTSGELGIGNEGFVLDGTITVKGLGAENLTISGQLNPIDTSIFGVRLNGILIIDGLTLTGVKLAIFSRGFLTVKNSIISDNDVGIHQDVSDDLDTGDFENGKIVISNTIITNNLFAGIQVDGGENGASADFDVNNSTISDNGGSGIANGESNFDINNCTISGNGGGAIFIFNGRAKITDSTLSNNIGSGISLRSSTTDDDSVGAPDPLILINTTITGNSAAFGGGINISIFSSLFFNLQVLPEFAGITLTDSTITGNSATEEGGGIIFNGRPEISQVTVNNSIIAGNSAPTNPDVAGDFISNGFNLIGVLGDSAGFEEDIIEPDITNILDSVLKNNGGSTQTHNLVPDSVAIDATGSDCPPPATDQRGVQRPQGTACDIGAVEFQQTDAPDAPDVPIDVSMCEIRTEYEPGGCKDKFNAYSLDDLDAYKASNFGKDGGTNYRNLVIKADIGGAGDILDIESPCKIFVSTGVTLAGDFISLDGRKGVRTNTIDINAGGSACLLSETESAKLKSHSTVVANRLVLRANLIAKIGENTQVNVNDSLTVQSTGSTPNSRAIVDKGANLMVGSDMRLSSGFRAVIQNNAVVDVAGQIQMDADTLNDCLVEEFC